MFLPALAVLGMVLGTSACTAYAGPGQRTRPLVVAALYPFAWLSREVGGSDIRVETLGKPGADPHDMELFPQQVIDVATADLVVYVGNIQPAVTRAVHEHARGRTLDAADVVRTLPLTGAGGRPGAYDPHVWLDPVRFAKVAEALGHRLAAVDPRHAPTYHRRAQAVVRELRDLDDAYRSGLSTCRTRTLVTGHGAFGYLAARYDLRQVSVGGLDPEIAPSLDRLLRVERVARRARVRVVFYESLNNGKIARALALDIGARAEPLQPIETAPARHRGGYVSLMRANLDELEKGLGCS